PASQRYSPSLHDALPICDVAIDMIAGPSEICIIADETAQPRFVAADLLSQAEHDEQARPLLIATNRQIAEAVKAELSRQTERLEDRKSTRLNSSHVSISY